MTSSRTIIAAIIAVASATVATASAEAQTKYMARQHLDMDKGSSSTPATEDPNVARPADVSKPWPQMTDSATMTQMAARTAAAAEDIAQRRTSGVGGGLGLLQGGNYGTKPPFGPWIYDPNGFWYARKVLNEPYAYVEFPSGFPAAPFCDEWEKVRNKLLTSGCDAYHQRHIAIYEIARTP